MDLEFLHRVDKASSGSRMDLGAVAMCSSADLVCGQKMENVVLKAFYCYSKFNCFTFFNYKEASEFFCFLITFDAYIQSSSSALRTR
jgi:hypothetical protein